MRQGAATAVAIQSRRRISDKPIALRKVHVFIPTGREENNELKVDLRRKAASGYGKTLGE